MTRPVPVTSSREDRKQRNPAPRPSNEAQAARRLLFRVQDRTSASGFNGAAESAWGRWSPCCAGDG